MSDVPHDVVVTNEGSVWAFYLETPAAQEFVREHVQTEPYQWLGAHVLVVEHGFGGDLVGGMREAGLTIVGREQS